MAKVKSQRDVEDNLKDNSVLQTNEEAVIPAQNAMSRNKSDERSQDDIVQHIENYHRLRHQQKEPNQKKNRRMQKQIKELEQRYAKQGSGTLERYRTAMDTQDVHMIDQNINPLNDINRYSSKK